MGRPRKDTDARRDDRLNLRLTPAERISVEANAAFYGLPPAEYARRCVLDKRMPASQSERQAVAARATALLRIGNNLNQLTRHAHAGRGIADDALLVTLARINAELDRLYDPAPG